MEQQSKRKGPFVIGQSLVASVSLLGDGIANKRMN
jgi:hypothetical protein